MDRHTLFLRLVGALLGAVGLYLLSFGPVYALASKRLFTAVNGDSTMAEGMGAWNYILKVQKFYGPIVWLRDRHPATMTVTRAYCDWWWHVFGDRNGKSYYAD